jgi:myo-inositol-1(or 4)-monophosphatase
MRMNKDKCMEETPFIDIDLSLTTTIAEAAAREAGTYLVSKLGHAHIHSQKAPRDQTLDVDLEAEQIILNKLRQHFPTYGLLSEEAGSEHEENPVCWIVDPLDGSANFQHGSSIFAISLALVVQQQTMAGIVYLPAVDEMFTALRGRGSLLNGKPVYTSTVTKVEEALIHVGEFSRYDHTIKPEQIQQFSIAANHASRVRMFGTSCTDLVWVACGRADALVMYGGRPWDVKAGALILAEAGGQISTYQNTDGSTVTIYTNGLIHQELATLLAIGTEEA